MSQPSQGHEEPEAPVLRLAVIAARAWVDATAARARESDPDRVEQLMEAALDALMEVGECRARTHRGEEVLVTPSRTLATLRTSLADLVMGGANEPLIVGPEDEPVLSEYAQSLLEWADQDPAAVALDQEFAALMGRLRALRDGGEGALADRQYRQFRETLIQQPIQRAAPLARWAGELGLNWPAFYEDLPPACRTGPEHRKAWLCPGCLWTLVRIPDDRMICERRACREAPRVYDVLADGELKPVRGEMPERLIIEDHRRIKAGVRRAYQLPGKDELELKARLERQIVGCEVRLWPELDSYDLHITSGERDWKVDVKAWTSGHLLTRRLRARPPAEGVIIAMNDELRYEMEEVKRQLKDIRIFAFSELITHIQRGAP